MNKHKIAELFSLKLNAQYEYDEPTDLFIKMRPSTTVGMMKPVVSVFALDEGVAMVWNMLDEEERKMCVAMMLSGQNDT